MAAKAARIAAASVSWSRAAAARTHEDLLTALWAALLRAISPADARGYFTQSGYPPLAQHA